MSSVKNRDRANAPAKKFSLTNAKSNDSVFEIQSWMKSIEVISTLFNARRDINLVLYKILHEYKMLLIKVRGWTDLNKSIVHAKQCGPKGAIGWAQSGLTLS